MEDNIYDVLIIGAGPIGLACGIEATKKGLSYLILEKGVFGKLYLPLPKEYDVFLHLVKDRDRRCTFCLSRT